MQPQAVLVPVPFNCDELVDVPAKAAFVLVIHPSSVISCAACAVFVLHLPCQPLLPCIEPSTMSCLWAGTTNYMTAAYKNGQCLFYREHMGSSDDAFDGATCRGSAWAGNLTFQVLSFVC